MLDQSASVKTSPLFLVNYKACPTPCLTCSDSLTCQSCQPGYALINYMCVQCPAGKYAPSRISISCSESKLYSQ